LGARLPGAVLREGVTRAGDDPPAGRGEALDRGVADAARGASQDQRLALGVGGVGHGLDLARIYFASQLGYRPHPFGGTPNPLFFDCKMGRVWEARLPVGCGASPASREART